MAFSCACRILEFLFIAEIEAENMVTYVRNLALALNVDHYGK